MRGLERGHLLRLGRLRVAHARLARGPARLLVRGAFLRGHRLELLRVLGADLHALRLPGALLLLLLLALLRLPRLLLRQALARVLRQRRRRRGVAGGGVRSRRLHRPVRGPQRGNSASPFWRAAAAADAAADAAEASASGAGDIAERARGRARDRPPRSTARSRTEPRGVVRRRRARECEWRQTRGVSELTTRHRSRRRGPVVRRRLATRRGARSIPRRMDARGVPAGITIGAGVKITPNPDGSFTVFPVAAASPPPAASPAARAGDGRAPLPAPPSRARPRPAHGRPVPMRGARLPLVHRPEGRQDGEGARRAPPLRAPGKSRGGAMREPMAQEARQEGGHHREQGGQEEGQSQRRAPRVPRRERRRAEPRRAAPRASSREGPAPRPLVSHDRPRDAAAAEPRVPPPAAGHRLELPRTRDETKATTDPTTKTTDLPRHPPRHPPRPRCPTRGESSRRMSRPSSAARVEDPLRANALRDRERAEDREAVARSAGHSPRAGGRGEATNGANPRVPASAARATTRGARVIHHRRGGSLDSDSGSDSGSGDDPSAPFRPPPPAPPRAAPSRPRAAPALPHPTSLSKSFTALFLRRVKDDGGEAEGGTRNAERGDRGDHGRRSFARRGSANAREYSAYHRGLLLDDAAGAARDSFPDRGAGGGSHAGARGATTARGSGRGSRWPRRRRSTCVFVRRVRRRRAPRVPASRLRRLRRRAAGRRFRGRRRRRITLAPPAAASDRVAGRRSRRRRRRRPRGLGQTRLSTPCVGVATRCPRTGRLGVDVLAADAAGAARSAARGERRRSHPRGARSLVTHRRRSRRRTGRRRPCSSRRRSWRRF